MTPRLCHTSFAAFLLINLMASGLAFGFFWMAFGQVAGWAAGGWTFMVFFIAFLLGADLPEDTTT